MTEGEYIIHHYYLGLFTSEQLLFMSCKTVSLKRFYHNSYLQSVILAAL